MTACSYERAAAGTIRSNVFAIRFSVLVATAMLAGRRTIVPPLPTIATIFIAGSGRTASRQPVNYQVVTNRVEAVFTSTDVFKIACSGSVCEGGLGYARHGKGGELEILADHLDVHGR